MNQLCFATNNQHKLTEVKSLISGKYGIQSLADIGCSVDIPEDRPTIEGNSHQKAQFIHDQYGVDCFADDTGLEVEFLQGAPGVYSARFAGPQRNDLDNMNLLLEKLLREENRKAQFRTVITLILKGEVFSFEGISTGSIALEVRGEGGFGYDPVFIPDGYSLSFAQISAEEKNSISHRGRAVKKLVSFLNHR